MISAYLRKKKKEFLNKQPNFTYQGSSKRRKKHSPKDSRNKEIIKFRIEIQEIEAKKTWKN